MPEATPAVSTARTGPAHTNHKALRAKYLRLVVRRPLDRNSLSSNDLRNPCAGPDREDVYDGFDILERVLRDRYSDHESVLAKIVEEINQSNGPRKRQP